MKMLIGIIFVIIGGVLVISLLLSIIKLLNYTWDKEKSNSMAIIKLFSTPLLSLLALIIFIFYILPYLEGIANS